MADIISDGMTKVTWVTTLSSLTIPSAALLVAGEVLEAVLTADGLGIEAGEDDVDTTGLNSTFATTRPGRGNVKIELTFKQQGYEAVPWTTFAARPSGFLVVRTGIASTTAWAASQKVDVYSVTAGDRRELAPAANELAKFAVSLFSSADPNLAVTTAA